MIFQARRKSQIRYLNLVSISLQNSPCCLANYQLAKVSPHAQGGSDLVDVERVMDRFLFGKHVAGLVGMEGVRLEIGSATSVHRLHHALHLHYNHR